jgi:hypothetical protein
VQRSLSWSSPAISKEEFREEKVAEHVEVMRDEKSCVDANATESGTDEKER